MQIGMQIVFAERGKEMCLSLSFHAFDLRLRAGVGLGFAGTVDISRSLACAKFTWKDQQTVGIFPMQVEINSGE